METYYAELFAAYEELAVDCVLFSAAGSPETPRVFATEAAGHAAANSIWISYADAAQPGHPPAGIIRPEGTWACQCGTGTSGLAVARLEAGAGRTRPGMATRLPSPHHQPDGRRRRAPGA